MARSRRSGRSTGFRGRRNEPAPEALDFAEPERPSRVGSRSRSSGGGGGGPGTIGLVIPMAVTMIAAVALLLTGFVTANAAKKGMEKVLDETGVGTALALSVVPTDWWNVSHGTENFWDMLMRKKDQLIAKTKRESDDERDWQLVEQEFDKFVEKAGIQKDPLASDKLATISRENRERLSRIVGQSAPGSPIIYAQVQDANGRALAATGTSSPNSRGSGSAMEIGAVKVQRVLVNGAPGRLYEAPIKDQLGGPGGKVLVFLTARPAAVAASGLTGTFLVLALVGIVLVAGVSFFLCLAASKGVRRVAGDLEQVARGDLDVRMSVRGGGEVATVARAADRAMRTFRTVQEQSIEAATAQPAQPVEAAVDTTSLLPSEPPRVDGYEIEAVHKPCLEGANDYYDYITVDDIHLGVVIADMPHGGPQGTFTAATFRALMRAFAVEETSPAAVLSKVNRVMASELKRGDHISAMYAVLDTDKGIVAVASAGHLPMVFWKLEKKGSALLNPEGIAIGLDKGPVFEKTVVDKRIRLDRGDRFVLYTDGPVAAVSASGEEFGEQRFYYLISREAPKNSAAFVNFVANEVDLFHEGAPQEDDITIVTVRKVKE